MPAPDPVPTGPRNFCAMAPFTVSLEASTPIVESGAPWSQFCTRKLCSTDRMAASISCTEFADVKMLLPEELTGWWTCLLYTSDAADEEDSVDLGGRRIIKKKKKK